MPKYLLHGDIMHPGMVEVDADSPKALLKLLCEQDPLIEGFKVHDEQSDCLAFNWNGTVLDEEGNEVEMPEDFDDE